jgi:hypothetical protein
MSLLSKILNDSYVKSSSIIEDIKNSVLVSEDEYKRRLDICNGCENLSSNFCSKCHCYMPAKAAIKMNACPLNLFDK